MVQNFNHNLTHRCWFSNFVLFLPLLVVNKVIKYAGGVFVAVQNLQNLLTLLGRNFLKDKAGLHPVFDLSCQMLGMPVT